MKVVFVPAFTRGNPHQRQLADALAELGIQVTMLERLQPRTILGLLRPGARPDVIHFHWTDRLFLARTTPVTMARSVVFVATVVLLKLLGIRTVWTVHNIRNHEGLHNSIEAVCHTVLVRLYDAMIVYCEAARATVAATFHMSERSQCKIATIYHGNYLGQYSNVVSRCEARRSLGIADTAVVVLFFGLVRPYKGVLELIGAFKRVAPPAAHLVIAGQCPSEQFGHQVVDAAHGLANVHLRLERIGDDEVQTYMNAADIVALPFRDVLSSGSCLLALSFGKPVLAPRLGCVREIVDCTTGVLYDPDASNGLERALEQALEADLRGMGDRCLERARRFGWDEIAWKTAAVYAGRSA